MYEWFYPDIDRVYFHVNEFQECLNDMGLARVRKLTRVEWSHVRSSMGKPRRLSRAFLKQERMKLYNTRNNVRKMRTGEVPVSPDSGLIPQDIPGILPVSTHVIVYHHKTLKKGIIQHAEKDGSRYKVLLEGHSHSHAVWINDFELMSLYADEYEAEEERASSSTPASKKRKGDLEITSNGTTTSPPRVYTKEELRNVASLVVLLERKEILLGELTAMNNQAEKMLAQTQEYPNWFQQRYAVLIVKLDEVNRLLEPALLNLHAARSSPTLPPIARTSYTDLSMLNFRDNWAETTVAESKRQAQTLIKGLATKYQVPIVMRDYAVDCISLLLQLQACAQHVRNIGPEDASADISTAMDFMLSAVRPKSEENLAAFSEIEQSVNVLKTKLTRRNPST